MGFTLLGIVPAFVLGFLRIGRFMTALLVAGLIGLWIFGSALTEDITSEDNLWPLVIVELMFVTPIYVLAAALGEWLRKKRMKRVDKPR